MAPARPKTFTAGSNPVNKFEGVFIVTKHTPPEGRVINFHCRIDPNHPRLLEQQRAGKKPPTHFHPQQWEYFRVEKGSLTVEIDGVPHQFVASDGEYAPRPGPHHRLYATPGQAPGAVVDQAFFKNWYGYQEEMMLRGAQPDLIQVLSMFDAGDTYLSLPAWVPEPFRRHLGWLAGVLVGRWVGGLLGYAPFYREWTTDWDAACDRMQRNWTQRGFAVRSLQMARRAEYLSRGEDVGNGGLYDEVGGYENWLDKKHR